MMKTALVCIAKDEDHYIDEWIEYHLKLGFSRIFVYQNSWRYKGRNKTNPDVEFIEFDGEVQQLPAYNDFIDRHWQEYDWAAFFDVDEFLCLKKYASLEEFLNRFDGFNAVGVNWRLFGDNGYTCVENGDYSLLRRFTKAQNVLNQHIKTILHFKKCMNAAHFVNPHFVDLAWTSNFTIDVDMKKFVRGPWNPGSTCNSAQLNHYHSKTKPEFVEIKMKRGRADIASTNPNHEYDISGFDAHNFNDIDDTTARDFMHGK